MSDVLQFGYGSLLDAESLRATAPSANNIRPAYIVGFRRDFSFHDPIGWKSTNLDVAGEPFCAVDVTRSIHQDRVNGIMFELSAADFEQLKIREKGYEIIKTPVYGYESEVRISDCYVFSANKHDGTYNFSSAAQKRYLEICLAGAKLYGEKFYQEYMQTTYIGSSSLAELYGTIDLE